jgi:hypothetical protein
LSSERLSAENLLLNQQILFDLLHQTKPCQAQAVQQKNMLTLIKQGKQL